MQSVLRTNNVRVYSKLTSRAESSMILEQEVFVIGFINGTDLMICFEESVGKGIKMIPVVFNDSDGKWCLNLWYTEVSMQPDYILVQDHAKLKEICKDYILMLRHDRESHLWTVICRSWHVCTELGMLQLPTPHKRILTMEECFQEKN